MARIFFRLDDITPNMNWDKFNFIVSLFGRYNIKPLLAVIPDNKDSELLRYPIDLDFWRIIKELSQDGWVIAQHGYQHLAKGDGGVLSIHKNGEFGGLSFESQEAMIISGRKIMEAQTVSSDVFVAPRHSFDKKTIRALKQNGFHFISDGIALWPFKKFDIVWLPQITWRPRKFPLGLLTFALHHNTMNEADFSELEKFVTDEALITSNTSSLSVEEMSKALVHPERFAGLHFFNPVHLMPLVEIIVHSKVSPETLGALYKWCLRVKKTPVIVKDGPGFLVNRILMPYMNEAGYLLEEGVALKDLDQAALNFGIKKAKGDIILFTDDDCLVPTNWVERYKKIFKENDVGVVGGYLIPKESNIFYAIDKIKDKILGVGYLGNKEIISRNIKVGFTNNCGYRKDVLMKVGFFNENFRVPAGEDTELNDRVAKHYNAMYIPISVIHNNKYNYQYLTNMVWKQVIEKMPPKNALSSTLGLIILSPWVLFKVIKKVIQYRK